MQAGTKKITVGGRDRTTEWLPALEEEARRRAADPRCRFLDRPVNALVLQDADSERAYLDRYLDLLRYKNGVDTRVFDIPRRPGLAGQLMQAVKKALWKLLRYQHDRMSFRQNLVNGQVTSALEFQRDWTAAELRRLEERLAALERKSGGGGGS